MRKILFGAFMLLLLIGWNYVCSVQAVQRISATHVSITNTTTMFSATNLVLLVDELETWYIDFTNTKAVVISATNDIRSNTAIFTSGLTTNVDLTAKTGVLYYSTGVLTNSTGN